MNAIRRWVRGLALVLIMGVASVAAETRPNVIVIMVDDFGYECVGANGCESYRTPNLDKLAATGIRFERAYVQPLCTPTRAQLMTGQYNVRNYVQFGLLDPQQTTFAHLFKQAGYATGIVGKWQLGGGMEGPGHFGFDDYCLWQLTRRPPRYANVGVEVNGREVDYDNGEYGPDVVAGHALNFIAANKDRPFLLYYPMILTHSPYQPTPDSPDYDPKAKSESANKAPRHFGEMVEYTDKIVGRIVDQLDELKLRERTLLIFLGDNGTGSGTPTDWNGQRVIGGKGSMHERGMRVPLVANWPGTIPAGQVSQQLVDSTDILPTICEAAGIAPSSERTLDGKSFLPECRGEHGQGREWIYCWYWPRPSDDTAPRQFAMNHDYKLFADGRLWKIDPSRMDETELPADGLSADAQQAQTRLQAVLAQFREARPDHLPQPVPGVEEVKVKKRKRASQ